MRKNFYWLIPIKQRSRTMLDFFRYNPFSLQTNPITVICYSFGDLLVFFILLTCYYSSSIPFCSSSIPITPLRFFFVPLPFFVVLSERERDGMDMYTRGDGGSGIYTVFNSMCLCVCLLLFSGINIIITILDRHSLYLRNRHIAIKEGRVYRRSVTYH